MVVRRVIVTLPPDVSDLRYKTYTLILLDYCFKGYFVSVVVLPLPLGPTMAIMSGDH